jgi:hypothetical protein
VRRPVSVFDRSVREPDTFLSVLIVQTQVQVIDAQTDTKFQLSSQYQYVFSHILNTSGLVADTELNAANQGFCCNG